MLSPNVLFEAVGRLLAGVEAAPANEAGYDGGLDGHDATTGISGENEVVRQAVQGVKRCRTAVGPAGAVNRTGFPVQKTGNEATMPVSLTDAAGAGEKPIVGFQGIQGERLRHGRALALDMDEATLKINPARRVWPKYH